MKQGLLTFKMPDLPEEFKFSIAEHFLIESCFYEVFICTDLKESFKELTKETHALNEYIDLFIDKKDPDFYDQYFYDFCIKNKNTLIKDAKYIRFEFPIQKIAKYIKENKELQDKKILFFDFDLSNETLIKEIDKYFGENTDNIEIFMRGNNETISYKEYSQTIEKINEIVNEVKQFNFSKLEQVMYVYDILKERVYKEEEKGESENVSRDLTNTLLGDKIVCLGYSKIFTTILRKLGINAKEDILRDISGYSGHARAEVYLKDEKYNIDGVFYFDPTWDSKKNDEDELYKYSFKYFAKTKREMLLLESETRNSIIFPYYSEDMNLQLEEILTNKDFKDIPDELLASINHMYKTIKGKYLIDKNIKNKLFPKVLLPNKQEVIKQFNQIMPYFNQNINGTTLLKALFNIRKMQYYYDQNKYPFNLTYFYNTALVSKWSDNVEVLKFLREIFGVQETMESRKEEIRYLLSSSDISKDLPKIRFLKCIKEEAKRKSEK